ncbi:hypothetical protein [Enhygromyxa salina]|uniref:Uncharacterized protein n=1 Tax=Enhygromyxa salina TaxID=215803 RepID=A0A2S9YH39_9BACT|nr:hypothetical protein [Enhygromyxa salina]PRQ04443.1 hypothetical protein ENSA7_51040 [Enhygromyxa salina]
MLVIVLAQASVAEPEPPPVWESWRWLGTADERVLWATLAAAALLAAWGGWPACRALWLAWRRKS